MAMASSHWLWSLPGRPGTRPSRSGSWNVRCPAVGKFPQEVVLYRPEVRKADLVSQFHLGHHLLVALLLDAVIVGFWHLDFVHEPKLHGSVLHMRSRDSLGRAAGQGWLHGVSTCILCPGVHDLQAEAVGM